MKKKKKVEFSKVILTVVAFAAAVIVISSFVIMWRTGDTSPLAYIIPGIFAELSAATGFYFWKAKAENQIKLDAWRKKLKLNEENPEDEEPEEMEG
jgi:peptidoglycan/LPS O-acetylase OafA/YrhL